MIDGVTFYAYTDIVEQSEFNRYINLKYEENLKIEVSNFLHWDFFNIINFIKSNIYDYDYIYIIDPIAFYDAPFQEISNLSDCVFFEDVIFKNCSFIENTYFNNCIFKKQVYFNRSVFKSKIRFIESTFESIAHFEDTTFENLVDFAGSTFKEPQQFLFTDFLNVAIFSRVTFEKQVQFLYNKVSSNSIISFESAEFNQAIDISRANFWCKMNFWGAKIVWVSNGMGLYQTDNINKTTTKENNKAIKRLRESCRIIKNEFTKDNNIIESIKYHKEEMNLYCQELIFNNKILVRKRAKSKLVNISKKSTKSFFIRNANSLYEKIKFCFKTTFSFSEERITLWFNKYSNHFGTSWSRGLIFTLLATLLFYTFFLLSLSQDLAFEWSWAAINETFKHFVEFLNIANWSIKPFGIENYNWAYFFLFIGRIFIGYGYYQTIQAFRKYGKN